MKKLELKTRKLLRTFLGCFSLTAAAFIFQACYGMGIDDYYDVRLTGTVTSKDSNLPIKGIKVIVNDVNHVWGMTDEKGKFDFYASVPNYNYYDKDSVYYKTDSVRVHFIDFDGIENGLFADTTIFINPDHHDEVRINMQMVEKK